MVNPLSKSSCHRLVRIMEINMNKEYEKNFVNKFIIKNKRDRLFFELSSPYKRKHAVGRFCHNTIDYVDERKIVYRGNTLKKNDLIKMLASYSNESQGYIISWNDNIDGEFIGVEEAISKIEEEGMASIFILNNVIFIKTEQEQGEALKYILHSN